MNRTFETVVVLAVSLAGIFVAARMGAEAPATRNPRLARAVGNYQRRELLAHKPTPTQARLELQASQLPCATLTPTYAAGCGIDRTTGEQYAEPIFSRPRITWLDLPLIRLPAAASFAPLETTGYDAAYDRSLTAAVVETDSVRFGPAVWGRNASEPRLYLEVSNYQWRDALPQLHAAIADWRRARMEQEYAAAELAAAEAGQPISTINLAATWQSLRQFVTQQFARLDRHPLEWLAESGRPAAGEVQINGLSPAELAETLQADTRRSADRKTVRESPSNRIRQLPAAPVNRGGKAQ